MGAPSRPPTRWCVTGLAGTEPTEGRSASRPNLAEIAAVEASMRSAGKVPAVLSHTRR